MYSIEKTQTFKNKIKHKTYRKTIEELAEYCLVEIQKFYAPALSKLQLAEKGNIDEKLQTGRIDFGDEQIQFSFMVVLDGALTFELFVVDKTVEALQEFMNYRCEDYRIYAHYKFKQTN